MDADLESSVHCKTARWLSFFIRYTKNTLKYVRNDIGQYVKRLPSVLWLSWLDFIKSNQIIQQSQMFFYKDIWWGLSLLCFDTVGWTTGRAPCLQKIGYWFDGDDILTGSFARLIAPVITITSITISSNKIENGDILVPANPGPPGKWPLKWRDLWWDHRLRICDFRV